MNMKRMLCFFLIAGLCVGCQPAGESSKTAGPKGTTPAKPVIALVMKSLANEFFANMAEGAKRHQREASGKYDLIVNGIKDEQDVVRQVQLVEELVAGGARAIVIAPADSKALVPVLKRIKNQGIVVVNIDNRLDEKMLEENQLQVPFVGPDNRAGARKVGDYLARQLKSGDEVAILEGVTTSFNAQQRKAGFEDAMRAAGIQIVDAQSAQWETDQANRIAANMLIAHPNLKAILAANDSMAVGALAAIRSAGKRREVQLVGFDNIQAVQQSIQEGDILATADQHGDQLAAYGIDYALQLLADPKATPADKETPVDLITADQLK
ncbi:MAG: sugar ABC transporter substrate-binding protein [Pirellulaceae bacterium]|jgi:ribose transport system substrate-binding protein